MKITRIKRKIPWVKQGYNEFFDIEFSLPGEPSSPQWIFQMVWCDSDKEPKFSSADLSAHCLVPFAASGPLNNPLSNTII